MLTTCDTGEQVQHLILTLFIHAVNRLSCPLAIMQVNTPLVDIAKKFLEITKYKFKNDVRAHTDI